jgi:Teichoic acid biosynthesis proteins
VDIFAGISKRAPAIFIKLGLEWFYRLCKEPWRFKRMMRLPLYLLKAVSWRLRHGKAKD